MVSRQSSLNILNNLKQDPENLRCFECGSELPDFVSVNNGCFICTNCVPSHIALGEGVSRTKRIDSDWSEEDLKLMIAGGNSALREFFSRYNLVNTPANFKYLTMASFYYRDMLDVLSKDREYQHAYPDLNEGVQLIVDSYPELGQIPNGEAKFQSGDRVQQEEGPWSWAKKAYLKTVDFGNKAADKMSEKLNKFSEENQFVRKVEDKTVKAVVSVEQGLNKAVDKVYSKPEVQSAIGQINHATNSLGNEVRVTYQKINTNPSVQKLKEDTMKMLRELKSSFS